MSWFKVDDKLHDHSKVRRALRGGTKRRDASALGLWCLAGSWSADNLMDGFVPSDELPRWDDDGDELAERLAAAGLWEVAERDGEPGYQFINWNEHQPTKADVEAKREAARERMRAARAKGGRGSGEVRANEQANVARSSRDVPSTPSRPVPSRPDPEGTTSGAPAPDTTPRADVEDLCTLLADRIAANGSKRPVITKTWRDAARLMLDRDARTYDDIRGAIEWCQTGTTPEARFWRGNVLSMPKLREKFDQMRLQAQRAPQSGRRNDIDWDLALDRARAMGGGS